MLFNARWDRIMMVNIISCLPKEQKKMFISLLPSTSHAQWLYSIIICKSLLLILFLTSSLFDFITHLQSVMLLTNLDYRWMNFLKHLIRLLLMKIDTKIESLKQIRLIKKRLKQWIQKVEHNEHFDDNILSKFKFVLEHQEWRDKQ